MTTSLHYISTIAGAERVMLYRTAKFWVLGGIGALMILFFMVVMTVATIIDNSIPGEFLLEGTDGFLALYFFSYVQAILIIFVAGDFRKANDHGQFGRGQIFWRRWRTGLSQLVFDGARCHWPHVQSDLHRRGF
jgi:hypothetical protein